MKVDYQNLHRDIIERCRLGDRRSQQQLYQLYSKAMFNICIRMMNNTEEAEDMLQEAFTEAFLKLESFRHESSFGAWLKKIVVNTCINKLKKREIDLVMPDKIPVHIADEVSVNEEDIQYNIEKVNHAVKQLPDGYRLVFSLYLMEGYDHQEIAEILNISESTSKTQYLRAKNKVKELLNSKL